MQITNFNTYYHRSCSQTIWWETFRECLTVTLLSWSWLMLLTPTLLQAFKVRYESQGNISESQLGTDMGTPCQQLLVSSSTAWIRFTLMTLMAKLTMRRRIKELRAMSDVAIWISAEPNCQTWWFMLLMRFHHLTNTDIQIIRAIFIIIFQKLQTSNL